MGLILLVILIVLLLGGFGGVWINAWPAHWGNGISILALILIVLLVILVADHVVVWR